MFSSNSSQVSSAVSYIEDVFSTYLYTGTGSSQTITNNIDLSTYGGLVWGKRRDTVSDHVLVDTVRGATKNLSSNATYAETTVAQGLTVFTSSGFTVGSSNGLNSNGSTLASWTFRKQPKFFDVVTFTTDVNGYALVSHNLGSTPAFVITKTTSSGGSDWACYHKDLNGGVNAGRYIIRLNTTAAANNPVGANNWIVPTSTTLEFPAGIWLSGNTTYVAYVFASNAGGFGLTGTDNVISCGSYTTNSSGQATITLGYEPQWVMIKNTNSVDDWYVADTMRGWSMTQGNVLYPNKSSAEADAFGNGLNPTATGFKDLGVLAVNSTFIYIAIRRGPMAVPTVGTSVYNGITRTGTGANATVTGAGFPVDLLFSGSRNAAFGTIDFDRLRGATQRLFTYATAAEAARATSLTSFAVQDGYTVGDDSTDGGVNNSGQTYIYWNFRRAPSFFDEVCYTGDGTNMTINHNLGVVPELMFVKRRSAAGGWFTYSSGTTTPNNYYLQLQSDAAQANAGATVWSNTSTTFLAGTGLGLSSSGYTYVAYLFATCAGVSKVGSYTGNGSTQAIACGFTGGARFVLIKRTDATGDWYVYDTARGMTTLTDPYLLLDTTAAETATLGSVTTTTGGFTVNAAILAAINTSSATYIFLAIA